jgi:hypothetical protein
MGFSIFDNVSAAVPHLLAERMSRQQFYRNKFGIWVAPRFVQTGAGKESVGALGDAGPKYTGAPIEVYEEFVKLGKNTMDIPIRNRLHEMPRHGDAPVMNTGEGVGMTFRTVPINYTRKVYNPPTGMSEQNIKQYADSEMFNAESFLTDWWNDYHPGNFILTMLAGASRDLVAPVTELGGRGMSYVSHPNFFTAGAGGVSYSGGRPGTSGYEASVEAALDGLTDTSSDYFSVGVIRNLVAEARRLKIAPIVLQNGFEFYPIWISDAQYAQLLADSEYKYWVNHMPEELSKHPVATSVISFVAGAAICTDLCLWGARTNSVESDPTAGQPEYGPAPTAAERAKGLKVGGWIDNLDTSDRKCGFLIGQGAMSIGVGRRMYFTERIDDHGFIKEIGIATIQSVVRSDIYDLDGYSLTKGSFKENTSSLAFGTFSPHNLSWA